MPRFALRWIVAIAQSADRHSLALIASDDGQDLVEYALLAAFIGDCRLGWRFR